MTHPEIIVPGCVMFIDFSAGQAKRPPPAPPPFSALGKWGREKVIGSLPQNRLRDFGGGWEGVLCPCREPPMNGVFSAHMIEAERPAKMRRFAIRAARN